MPQLSPHEKLMLLHTYIYFKEKNLYFGFYTAQRDDSIWKGKTTRNDSNCK